MIQRVKLRDQNSINVIKTKEFKIIKDKIYSKDFFLKNKF